MTQWYVKDLSQLTGITVQTLHHYDRINLLKPSLRAANGYRVYSESDLLKLQQIIALKFFGFELLAVKALLADNRGALASFVAQADFLAQKASALHEASKALKGIISDVKDDKSIPWQTIIELIEVYRMTQKLENSWVKEIYTPEELKEYVAFETELKTQSTPGDKEVFEKKWFSLTEEIQKNLQNDPGSEVGIRLAEKCMLLINGLYGKKYAHLRTKKFEQGFAQGKGLEETGLTKESVAWLEKGMDAYWRQRIYAILGQVGNKSSADVLHLWNEVLDDMYGNDIERKKELVGMAMMDEKVSSNAKLWLKSL